MTRTKKIAVRAGVSLVALALFLLLRIDVAIAIQQNTRVAAVQLSSPMVINRYLHSNVVKKLQLGAGWNKPAGWLNTDIEPTFGQAYLDASKPFPLPDGSFRYIFSEDMIEHITYEQGIGMLRESYRVMEPGGKIRIATADLDRFLALFRENPTQEMRQFMKRKPGWHEWPVTPDPACYILNHELREWGHQFVYTERMLKASMESVGFRNIRRFSAGKSDDPALTGVETRASWDVSDVNDYEAMILEGEK